MGKTVVEQHFSPSSYALSCKVTRLRYGSECCSALYNYAEVARYRTTHRTIT